jgi:hypothetical protein
MEWTSVKDRMPDDVARVLVFDEKNGHIEIGTYWPERDLWRDDSCCSERIIPSHWMPLPGLPEAAVTPQKNG